MYIDFALINTDISETDAKNLIKDLIENSYVNSITVPFYFIKLIKPYINNGLDFSCLIDYPLGISDIKTRCVAVQQAVEVGFNTLDITMPQNLAANRKYDKIREDIKLITDSIGNNKINLRYVLEYRKFDHHCLKKVCEIFENGGIKYIFPSSGYFLDNITDNLIASFFLHKNSKDLKIICSSNLWLDKHFEAIINSGLFGFRTSSIYTIQNFINFNKQKNSGV